MESLNEFESRKQKTEMLRQHGVNPFPARPNIDRTNPESSLRAVRGRFESLIHEKTPLWVAGRVRSKREHGGSVFLVIEDEGARMQLYGKRDVLGDDFALLKESVDLGDFIEAKGTAFTTKTGEQTIEVTSLRLLTKATLPLPEQWHGLSDVEVRYRKRYLDLLVNPVTRENAKKRAAIIRAIREFLDGHEFVEVETPILQPLAGGALARPFVTHHNALDADLYLRVAPELYLKRLIVGGFERVYEIARCFRNEGIDHSHNPEFTQVEFYYAYIDYLTLMEFTEKLLFHVVQSVGPLRVPFGGETIDFTPPYPRLTFRESLQRYAGIDIEQVTDAGELTKHAKRLACDVAPEMGFGKIADELFKTLVRPKIIQPTFIIDHPLELSPLAKKKEDDPRYVERFQLLLGPGLELCNAFSELNDPDDQYERFFEQEKLRAGGDDETMRMDDDYIEALRYGMPPTAGFGMGIDRLVSILTNSHSLKEIIIFPTLKPKVAKSESVAIDAKITRDEAWKLLCTHLQDEKMIKHCLATEAFMNKLADRLGESKNREAWGIAGLVHDIDMDLVHGKLENHSVVGEELLNKAGVAPEVTYAVRAHNWVHGDEVRTLLDKALRHGEQITGLITAVTLVRPDKKLHEVKVSSIKKKFKEKTFAAGVDRSNIEQGAAALGLPLDELFELCLQAMQEIHEDLGF